MGMHADECFEKAMQEMFLFQLAIEELTASIPDQKVVDDILSSFRTTPVDKYDKSECLARDILVTIAQRKNLSKKQKSCLIKVLVERNTSGYEFY
ncbi:hypothetical protein ABFV99_13960 [Cytobacillus horneckiae]|uniref:hypothetical protein n=1 Tax=Cytobacillus horneckiae TaxID=549687 RepID=UPI0034CD19FB